MVPAGTTIGGGGGGGAGAGVGGAAAGVAAAAGAVVAGAGAAAGVEDAAGWLAGGCVAAGSLAGAAAGWDAACSWSVDFLHPENSNPAESNVVTRKSLLRLIKTFLPDNGFEPVFAPKVITVWGASARQIGDRACWRTRAISK